MNIVSYKLTQIKKSEDRKLGRILFKNIIESFTKYLCVRN